jgi:hypothetical protein
MVHRFFLFALTAAILFNCDEKFNCEDFKLGSPIVVKPNVMYQDCPGELFITMLRVENDSRCPSDVTCIWAGNADVIFLFRNGDGEEEISLNINGAKPSGEREKVVLGYLIKLNGLNPYPVSTSTIKQKDYRAEITITKAIFD